MSRPKDARAMVRAMIEAAERRRLAAEPLPDLPLFQEQLLDERIKVGRHAEDWAGWLDWTTGDTHKAAMATGACFLIGVIGTVLALTIR